MNWVQKVFEALKASKWPFLMSPLKITGPSIRTENLINFIKSEHKSLATFWGRMVNDSANFRPNVLLE